MGLQYLTAVIDKSTLADPVKKEVLEVLRADGEKLERWVCDSQYKSPRLNFAAKIADYVLHNHLAPVFMKYHVPVPQGRDIHRLLYASLGGLEEVQFETIKDAKFIPSACHLKLLTEIVQ